MINYEQIAVSLTKEVAELNGDDYSKWDNSALRNTGDIVFVYGVYLSEDRKLFSLEAVDSQSDSKYIHEMPVTSSSDEVKIALGELIEDFTDHLQENLILESESDDSFSYDSDF